MYIKLLQRVNRQLGVLGTTGIRLEGTDVVCAGYDPIGSTKGLESRIVLQSS